MSIAGMKFDPTINMGAVMQAVTLVSGIVVCAAVMNSNVDFLRKDFDRATDELKRQQQDLRTLEKAHVETAADIRYIKTAVSSIQQTIDAYRGIPHTK